MIDSRQCRMARAALGWSATDLANRARVGVATVNRFETAQAEPNGATIAAIQLALETAGAIFDETPERGVRMRRLREGDEVRLRSQSRLLLAAKDLVGRVFWVEGHPPQTGPTYRASVEFSNGDRIDGAFAYEFELLATAPESTSSLLDGFQSLREETEFDGVIIHCFDGRKLVIAVVERLALEDYFGLPRRARDRRPSIAECSSIVDFNLPAFKQIIQGKYSSGDLRMLNRAGSTRPFIELTIEDMKASGLEFREPPVSHVWV